MVSCPHALNACRSGGIAQFEAALLDLAPHCEVHIFDPTLEPSRRAHVEALVPGATFHAIGLGGSDTDVSVPPQWHPVFQ